MLVNSVQLFKHCLLGYYNALARVVGTVDLQSVENTVTRLKCGHM